MLPSPQEISISLMQNSADLFGSAGAYLDASDLACEAERAVQDIAGKIPARPEVLKLLAKLRLPMGKRRKQRYVDAEKWAIRTVDEIEEAKNEVAGVTFFGGFMGMGGQQGMPIRSGVKKRARAGMFTNWELEIWEEIQEELGDFVSLVRWALIYLQRREIEEAQSIRPPEKTEMDHGDFEGAGLHLVRLGRRRGKRFKRKKKPLA